MKKFAVKLVKIKAIFHCGRFARAGNATAMENCLKIAVCEKTAGLRSGNFSN
jgi:hypothetical protein